MCYVTGSIYTLNQAIEHGTLAEIFKDRWEELSGGKPIVATRHLFEEMNPISLVELWNKFAEWQERIKGTLPEDKRVFMATINDKEVWGIEDEQAFALIYPEDFLAAATIGIYPSVSDELLRKANKIIQE
jgi:hypothetical protein